MAETITYPTSAGAGAGAEAISATSIRSAMSLSNVLTPPGPGSDVPGSHTPGAVHVAQASALAFQETVNCPGPASHTGDADGDVAMVGDESSLTNGAPGNAINGAPGNAINGAPGNVINGASGNATIASTAATDNAAIANTLTGPHPVGPATGSAVAEFICKNDEHSTCQTGQVTLNLSRKVISDHFGRNKACTRLIKDWPLFCRKHYQRATYNTSLWQIRKVNLILRQFDVIDEQIPGTKYHVVLKKSEEARLNKFSRLVTSGMSVDEAAEAEGVKASDENKSFEAPIDILRELEDGLGLNKTMNQSKETVRTILDMLQKQETEQVPSIEFLPQLAADGAPITISTTKPKKTKAKRQGRVAGKAGVQKKTAPRKAATKAKAKSA